MANIINQIVRDIKGKKASDTYEGNNRYLLQVAGLCAVGAVACGLFIHPLAAIPLAGLSAWKLKIWYFNKS